MLVRIALVADRPSIEEAVFYFEQIVKGLPQHEQGHVLIGFGVIWNTIARKLDEEKRAEIN